jgi:hemoglobin
MNTTTLYHRLGATRGIEALVDSIVDRHMRNPAIKARFMPVADEPARLAEVKQHLCRFIEAGAGGEATYGGRSMPEAHRGMNISAAEYMAAVDDILLALKDHSIDEQTQKDMLAIAWSLKDEIVHL